MRRTIQSIPSSQQYILTLGGYLTCPKRGCRGKLIPVLVRYQREDSDGKPVSSSEIVEELECTKCGKVVKDTGKVEKLKRGDNNIKEEDANTMIKAATVRKRRRR